MDLWKATFLYNPVVFRFYVNLPGYTSGGSIHIPASLQPKDYTHSSAGGTAEVARRFDGQRDRNPAGSSERQGEWVIEHNHIWML